MTDFIDIETIIKINKSLTGPYFVIFNQTNLDSVLSSYFYEEFFLNQVASIYRSIVKNHAFGDANKRTGTVVLSLIIYNNLNVVLGEDELVDLALDVANNKYSVSVIAKRINKALLNSMYPYHKQLK